MSTTTIPGALLRVFAVSALVAVPITQHLKNPFFNPRGDADKLPRGVWVVSKVLANGTNFVGLACTPNGSIVTNVQDARVPEMPGWWSFIDQDTEKLVVAQEPVTLFYAPKESEQIIEQIERNAALQELLDMLESEDGKTTDPKSKKL